MKSQILAVIKYIFFLSIGFGILLFLVKNQGADQVKKFYELDAESSSIASEYSKDKQIQYLALKIKTEHQWMYQNPSAASAQRVEALNTLERELVSKFKWSELILLGLSKISSDLSKANYFWIFLSMFFALLSHYIRAIRWNLLIHPMGYKPRSINSFFAVMIGYVANLVIPRMGEVSRCAILSKSEKISADKLIGTVIVERAVDLISLLSLTLITFIFQLDIILSFFTAIGDEKQVEIFTIKNLAILLGVVLILFSIFKFGVRLFLKLISGSKFFFKMTRMIAGLRAGLKSISQLKSKRLFIFYTLSIWFCYFLMIYLAFPSYAPTNDLSMFAGLSSLVIGSFGMVAPVQGGIGAYHWCLQKCLELYGISSNDGLTLAFIVHTAQTLLVIILGVVSIMFVPMFTKKKR